MPANDPSASHSSQDAPKAAESRHQSLLDLMPDGVFVNAEGRIAYCNPSLARLIGAPTCGQIIGRPALSLFPSRCHDTMRQRIETIERDGAVPTLEDEVIRLDGTTVPVEVVASAIPYEGRRAILVSLHDISDRKRLEAQLRQAQKMEAVGRLAGGVAHDFNNLLTIISGYTELLLATLSADDPTREAINEIKTAGEKAASLTRQLLAFSRKQVLEPRVLDLNALVADSSRLLSRLLGEDIELKTTFGPGLGHVRADPGQVEQIVVNLAINARDAMPRGGKLTIETANVELDERYCQTRPHLKPGGYVLLAMGDTGIGMDERTKSQIFEPFFTTKEAGKGTGLGLSMVYGFVLQSGGHIDVYSEVGLGTTFKVYLPEVHDIVTARRGARGLAVMPRGTETILLVEDEDAVRALAGHALRTCGYTVVEAGHGSDAVRLVETHEGPIHLLVTDVVMPSMGGRVLAEAVAKLKPGVKVLFLSGYTDDAVVRHGVLAAEMDFLQKPFTPSSLAQKAREVLDRTK